MVTSYEDLIRRVKEKSRKKRVIAVAADLHTLEGINAGCGQDLIDATLVGDEGRILELIRAEDLELGDVEIVNEPDDRKAAQKAVDLIRSGKGDFLMKGRLQTAEIMQEVIDKDHGLKTDRIMSHVGLFQIPAYHKLIAITDGGMIISPDVNQKKLIIDNAVEVLRQIGIIMPKVAVLCATEIENPKMQASLDGAELKRWNQKGMIKDCIVEGPISFDLMFDQESAKIKGYCSPVTGDTDICLMPDMTAGNLLAKAMMYTAEAKMAGIIVGASVPIVVVSRGATAEEKYLSLVLAAAVAK